MRNIIAKRSLLIPLHFLVITLIKLGSIIILLFESYDIIGNVIYSVIILNVSGYKSEYEFILFFDHNTHAFPVINVSYIDGITYV